MLLPVLPAIVSAKFGRSARRRGSIVYNRSTGSLIYDNNGKRRGGATAFTILKPDLALHAANFVVG